MSHHFKSSYGPYSWLKLDDGTPVCKLYSTGLYNDLLRNTLEDDVYRINEFFVMPDNAEMKELLSEGSADYLMNEMWRLQYLSEDSNTEDESTAAPA